MIPFVLSSFSPCRWSGVEVVTEQDCRHHGEHPRILCREKCADHRSDGLHGQGRVTVRWGGGSTGNYRVLLSVVVQYTQEVLLVHVIHHEVNQEEPRGLLFTTSVKTQKYCFYFCFCLFCSFAHLQTGHVMATPFLRKVIELK